MPAYAGEGRYFVMVPEGSIEDPEMPGVSFKRKLSRTCAAECGSPDIGQQRHSERPQKPSLLLLLLAWCLD